MTAESPSPEELDALERSLRNAPHNSLCAARRPDSSTPCYCVKSVKAKAATAIAAVRAALARAEQERDALRADAERYRWMRAIRFAFRPLDQHSNGYFVSEVRGVLDAGRDFEPQLDAAIDAARQAAGEQ